MGRKKKDKKAEMEERYGKHVEKMEKVRGNDTCGSLHFGVPGFREQSRGESKAEGVQPPLYCAQQLGRYLHRQRRDKVYLHQMQKDNHNGKEAPGTPVFHKDGKESHLHGGWAEGKILPALREGGFTHRHLCERAYLQRPQGDQKGKDTLWLGDRADL